MEIENPVSFSDTVGHMHDAFLDAVQYNIRSAEITLEIEDMRSSIALDQSRDMEVKSVLIFREVDELYCVLGKSLDVRINRIWIDRIDDRYMLHALLSSGASPSSTNAESLSFTFGAMHLQE